MLIQQSLYQSQPQYSPVQLPKPSIMPSRSSMYLPYHSIQSFMSDTPKSWTASSQIEIPMQILNASVTPAKKQVSFADPLVQYYEPPSYEVSEKQAKSRPARKTSAIGRYLYDSRFSVSATYLPR